ncbi:MAG: IclR family transcriptional regulator [Clostridiaceae bacterium]
MDKTKDTQLLQSVDNALRLTETLNEQGAMGITELSRELGLGKSTVFRLISTLENRNYVVRDSDSGKYMLSLKWVTIGKTVLKKHSLIKVVHPYLEKLSERYNETAYLSVLNGYQMTFVDKVTSTNAIIMDIKVGSNMPAYCTATGKILLAHKYRDDIGKYVRNIDLRKYTENTITDAKRLKKELESIRLSGYSADDEENEIGLTCFAAPIRNSEGEVIAAISISGPTGRMVKSREELITAVKETALEISRILGWSS